ncbi:hypothetical protein [Vibrio crassostreae]|uniref:hypothetical protein n=1 Tax=Vibrio crassostreae TaxID=246167 RepID=UPI001B30E2BE|nr:hypothetical protein [Vibrio crassostreae]CAK1953805.1 conserved hypothetical protein [Vibrio crassostreae]CAK1954311.1 conserved hypothetical protein [Vibrio crassostreae]CAK1956169.1 conserved hypothetical protein [Vibrio crassostreae]CAK1959435.1 conserved hypothetical protein [Vibrio crassostreae]CAK1962938.1 conserved hypothetical protein [Vibrio crassostreae]
MARKTNQKEEVVQPEVVEGNELATVVEDVPVDHFTNIVLDGKAKKLSPKTENHVFYQLSVHDDLNALFLRLSGNEGGGLHSKEWVAFEDIIAVLNEQDDKPFKSTVLKSVFKGGSANNAGFMAAALRRLLLILPSEKSVFLHVLAPDYEQRRDELMSLVDGETEAK